MKPAPFKHQRKGTETMGREQIGDFRAPFARAAERRGASTLTLQYALLKSAVEASAKTIGDRDAEIAELQRKAIVSLHECAEAVLQMAGLLEGAPRSSDAVSRYLGPGRGTGAAFAEQVNDFFEYARSFMLQLASADRGGPVPARPAPPSRPASVDFQERLQSLSPCQKRAFDLLVKGLPNKLIAYELGLAESTVKAHMSALFRKLQVRSRTHAIAMAAGVERERSRVMEIASGAEILEGAPLGATEARTGAFSTPRRDARPPLRGARTGHQ